MVDKLAAESGAWDDSIKHSGFDPRDVLPDITPFYEISNARAAWNIIRQWLVIAAAAWFAIWSHHWAGYILSAFIIATRQHALAVILHDAAHFRLFTSRKVGEFVSDMFCGFPVGLSTTLYRKTHLMHHRFTSTDKDPDWVNMHEDADWDWPKPMWETMKIFAFDIIGLKALAILKIFRWWSPWPRLSQLGSKKSDLSPMEQIRFVAYIAILVTGLTLTHGWLNYLFLWLIPSVTILSALFRMRSIAEHLVLPNTHELNGTRHIQGTFLERLIISPLNINYHLAHHMFPAVPLYNLPKVMDRLMKDERFCRAAAITTSYTSLRNGVLAEVITNLQANRRADGSQAEPVSTAAAKA